MFNIIKENKELKKENIVLKKKIEKLEKDNTDGMMKLKEYYDRTIDHRLKFIKCEYNTKIERKEQIIKICNKIEKKINNINNINNSLIDNYIKLLNYLKED